MAIHAQAIVKMGEHGLCRAFLPGLLCTRLALTSKGLEMLEGEERRLWWGDRDN